LLSVFADKDVVNINSIKKIKYLIIAPPLILLFFIHTGNRLLGFVIDLFL